ncbi:IS66 family transposase [Rhizobium anhuiense]|uniref:IS66 family transposase n=1 Tax=Rhizobium anhuiense TaxID=1184720 RepID=UPI003CC998B9
MLIAKYYDHLPLYRQSEIYAREGVDLSRSTMPDWIGSQHIAGAAAGEASRACIRGSSTSWR